MAQQTIYDLRQTVKRLMREVKKEMAHTIEMKKQRDHAYNMFVSLCVKYAEMKGEER